MDQGLCVQIGVAVDLEATGKLAVVAANENLSAPMNRPVFKQKYPLETKSSAMPGI
jgi:hypothetical protein